MLKIHTDWLNNAEKILGSFKYPSKIVDRILKQIQDHQVGVYTLRLPNCTCGYTYIHTLNRLAAIIPVLCSVLKINM